MSDSHLDAVRFFVREGKGRPTIAKALGITSYRAQVLIDQVKEEDVTKCPHLLPSVDTLSPSALDKLSSDALCAVLQSGKFNLYELCEKLNAAPHNVRQSLVELAGVKKDGERFWMDSPAPLLVEIHADRVARQAREEAQSFKAKYETLLREYEEKETALNAALGIADAVRPIVVARKATTGLRGQATAISVISDWHAGAIVKPNTVNFRNEFNPDIFEERAHNYFRNLLTLINKERAAVEIAQLVLAIIGDLIENSLHPELVEEQTLSPIEQTILAQNTIAGGLDYLLKESDLEQITIPTCPGNHGRTTDKMRAATNYKNSYEQLLYWNLARHYKSEPRVVFQVSDSYVNYTQVYDKTIGWHHGDGTKFQGGVGGLIIPLRKFAYRVNQQRKIDVLVNGHWHTQFVDNDIWSNGSLVGATAYGMRLGFAPERPQQIFRLLDADDGFTAYFPVLVERKVAQ